MIVHTKSFWTDVKLVLRYLVPIVEVLSALEADACPLSEVYKQRRWLLRHSAYTQSVGAGSAGGPELCAAISRSVREWGDRLQRSFAVAAFLLDQTTNTDELDEDELDRAVMGSMSLASRVDGGVAQSRKLRSELRWFLDSKQSWTGEQRETYLRMKPWAWWQAHGAQFPLFHDLALGIFSIPTSASTKECESAASKFASVYAANRSKLQSDQVQQLAFVEINRPRVVQGTE